MTFNIDRTTNALSQPEFDRLFDEALYYMSEERQRLGDALKEDIWQTFERDDAFIHRYEVDGYLVGAGSLTELTFRGKATMKDGHGIFRRFMAKHKLAQEAGGTARSFQSARANFVTRTALINYLLL